MWMLPNNVVPEISLSNSMKPNEKNPIPQLKNLNSSRINPIITFGRVCLTKTGYLAYKR